MVTISGGPDGIEKSQEAPKVSREHQNKAIREEAGNFLKNLRDLPNGDKLVRVVTAFGQVAHSYIKYRTSKNNEGNPPHQASKIEPLDELNLNEEARSLYVELLRYSVFFEDSRGKSRRGKIVPRLYLRRFLIPQCKLTFSMRDSLELEPSEFQMLLLEPDKFESKKRLRTISKTSTDENQQKGLFTDQD